MGGNHPALLGRTQCCELRQQRNHRPSIMLPISRLMDAPADSAGAQLFEEHEISRTVTAADSSSFFEQHGLFYQEDAVIGEKVDSLDRLGLLDRPDSFQHFREHIIGDPRIYSILGPYLDVPNPHGCYSFSSDPGHIFAFTLVSTGDRVVVHMWSAGSSMNFYHNAHTRTLRGVLAANGLMEIPEASLKKNDCIGFNVKMEKGGIAIHHERCAFQIKTGYTTVYGLRRAPHK